MKTTSCVALALIAALTGCASGKLKQQQAKIMECETRAGKLLGQVKDGDTKASSLQAQIQDLESQVADKKGKLDDLEAKLKSQQDRINSLNKSNRDLKSAIEANQGELSGKVAEVVKEKDDLAQRLAALQKDKIAADRARLKTTAARDQMAGEYAALKAQLDELTTAAAAAQAAKAKEQEERAKRVAKTREEVGGLADVLLKELQDEQAKIEQNGVDISLTLQEPLLFKPQSAKLTENGVALLDRIGRTLQTMGPRSIQVEGHSDNSAIKWDLFGSFTSHWDLSATRAAVVARYLHEHAGLDPRRLTASGFGEFRPVKGNDTPSGREANRRVVLIVEPPTPAP